MKKEGIEELRKIFEKNQRKVFVQEKAKEKPKDNEKSEKEKSGPFHDNNKQNDNAKDRIMYNKSVYVKSSNINSMKNQINNENNKKKKENELENIRKSLISIKDNKPKKKEENNTDLKQGEKKEIKEEEKKEVKQHEKKEIKKIEKKEEKKSEAKIEDKKELEKEEKKESKGVKKEEIKEMKNKDKKEEKKEVKKEDKKEGKTNTVNKDEVINALKNEIKKQENQVKQNKSNFKEKLGIFSKNETKVEKIDTNDNKKNNKIKDNSKNLEQNLVGKEIKNNEKKEDSINNNNFKTKLAIFNDIIEKNKKKETETQDFYTRNKTFYIKNTIKNMNKENYIKNDEELGEYKETFEILHSLQTLLKKESSFRELCKFKNITNLFFNIVIKTREETKKKIDSDCIEIYKKKIEVMDTLAEKKDIDNRKYKLICEYEKQHDYFQDAYTYIPGLLEALWDQPKIVAKLITNSDKNDVKKNLSSFFMNNFYENILSSTFIEDNLIYVITLSLKDEIDNMKNINDINSFLEETSVGYFLEKLNFKTDVINYYKIIIEHLIENLENMSSSKKINFNVKETQEYFLKMKEIMEEKFQKTGEKINIIDNNFFRMNFLPDINNDVGKTNTKEEDLNKEMKSNKSKQEFNSYMPDVTEEEVEKKISENENNKGMKEYCDKLLKTYQKEPKIFSNEIFLANVFNSTSYKEVLALYQIDFFKVIKIIDDLFNTLINNIYLIPYSVKCICKIIGILAKKKFKNLSIIDQNIFLSNFFFKKLFLPAFKDPKFSLFINNFIISGTTIDNLDMISNIIEKLISFDFIKNNENCDLTPFNRYFLDKIPIVFKFFDDLSNVKLPSFIEKVLNDKDDNLVYDYFKENNEEIIFHRSICFNTEEFICLLDNIEKFKDLIFLDDSTKALRITFEKVFYSNKEIIEELKTKSEYEEILIPMNKKKKGKIEKRILNYFLFTKLLVNDKYKHLFKLSQEKPNFTLKEINKTENEDDIQKNNVIKVKNLFSGLLYNYRNLVQTDFNEGTTGNTLKILKELKKFMKSSNFVMDGSIPSEWYVDSLFECLKLLPKDYQKNDYEKLYHSLIKDVGDTMKEMDFETLSFCLGKVKFANRGKIYYEKMIKNITEIELNEKVQNIIEKAIIPVTITLNSREGELKIEKGKTVKEIPFLDIFKDDNDKKTTCSTIESFGKKFPNIELERKNNYSQFELIEFEEHLNLTEELTNYFNIVREHLIKKMNFDETQKEFEITTNKIYDYVMEKIYDKIYPSEPYAEDNRIFVQCILVSWIEPKHLINGKNNYLFDSFLPDVINFFEKIDQEKSPRKKLENMKNIFISIENVVKFNGDNKDLGVDDQLPILNYAFIKARPFPIYTNCKYMELFLGSKKYKLEGNYLTQLFTVCKFIEALTAENLFDITEEQFQKKCNESREIKGF